MTKNRSRAGGKPATGGIQPNAVIEGDFSQSNRAAKIRKKIKSLGQKRGAINQFIRQRLIVRRRAMGDGRDRGIDHLQAIVAIATGGLIGKSGLIQSAKEKITGAIAREDTTRSVATMRSGSQTDNQQPSGRGSKIWNRFSPVSFVAEGGALLGGLLPAVRDQPRTLPAFDDLALKSIPGRRHVSFPQVILS